MKKEILFFTTLLSIPISSAYIDPGTGGYLATSTLSTLLTYVAILFAGIAAFFSSHIIQPIKKFVNKKRLLIIVSILIIVLFFLLIKNSSLDFDPNLSGAHIVSPNKISPGYILYSGKLIDQSGNVIKEWDSKYLSVLDKNGDYYAQKYYESPTWGRYSWSGEVIWEKDIPIHHEIVLTPQDTIITFTKETKEYNGRLVEFDIILELDKSGNIIDRWSTWDALSSLQEFHKPLELDQPPSFLISEDNEKDTSIWGGNYDYYHLNSLSIVPENDLQGLHKAFTPGNWIISFRHGSMIFILDKDTKEVLWRAIYDQIPGNLEGQHTPFMTKQGNIIVFDNGRYREQTRIISINPINLEITWEYSDPEFYTLSQGSVQLLPNKNLLITESESGRIFELTPEKEIVWEYYTPDIQNETNSLYPESYGKRQWIYKSIKYEKDFINLIKKP